MFDYETLKIIWWFLIGVLLIGFAIMDGYGMGSASLLLFTSKSDEDKRVVINSIAPHWDGNQVWLVTAGGAIFAAWPMVYAIAFSGFYWAILIVLFALIFRPVAFEYRSKLLPHQQHWCDIALIASGTIPPLIFGVAFGNLFLGYSFNLDDEMRATLMGSFWSLLHPFALLCGLVSLSMVTLQGTIWLAIRTHPPVADRAIRINRMISVVFILSFALAGLWVYQLPGFEIISTIDPNIAITPLDKNVLHNEKLSWLDNYKIYPTMLLLPAIAFIFTFINVGAIQYKPAVAFVLNSLTIACVIITAGFSLFPFILPSSLNPDISLTVWDATSSQHTLLIMTWVAFVMVPIVLSYTGWCFYKMWERISCDDIKRKSPLLY